MLKTALELVVWNLHEQVFVAALETGDEKTADFHLDQIFKRFPKSERSRKLLGMNNEFKQNFKEALEIYDQILQENPANIQVMKRKVNNIITK